VPDRSVRRLARAKINLFLRIKGLREDGYHDLESLIVPTSAADEVVCREAPALNFHVEEPAGETGKVVSEGPDNLVVVAALALAEARPSGGGADITLIKRIPVAAGLGGGSSDAAATLLGLNELWDCGLSDEELHALAFLVGSDVPALLHDGPVLVGGRGEVESSVTIPEMWWVIVPFDFQIKTPQAFGWWDEDSPAPSGDRQALMEAVDSQAIERIAAAMFNDLETPVIGRHPEIGGMKSRLLGAGALGAIMCGSGPTAAGLYPDNETASKVASSIPGAMAVLAPAILSNMNTGEGYSAGGPA
jgi:4-diphosphocytidyl-2-C-methyl-D-erythritol kinase